MNCDQVFDILTRGPFPTGDRSDRAVELHLAVCPECQRLANALRPAIELFQEALTGDEGRELPGYWGGMIDEAEERYSTGPLAQVTRHLPVALHRRIDRGRRWVSTKTGGNGLRFVAAMLIGVALGAVVWTAGVPAKDSSWNESNRLAVANLDSTGQNYSGSNDNPAWSSRKASSGASDLRISLQLADACLTGGPHLFSDALLTPGHSAALSLAELTRLNCCTRCHHASAEKSVPRATAAVANSCEICHK